MKKYSIPAIVLDLNVYGLGIARSLGRMGISVIGLDSEADNSYCRTRFIQKQICPNLKINPHDFLDYFLKLGKTLGKRALVFPTNEAQTLFIMNNYEELKEFYIFPLPDKTIIDALIHKNKFQYLCEENRIFIPKTFIPGNEEDINSIANKVAFPCILKPVYSEDRCRLI